MADAATPFDPSRYLTKVSGSDYLEVKWRVLWFRTEHPDGEIETEMTTFSGEQAVFRARVSIPGGGSATGWGSETYNDFRDFVEKAECVPLTVPILTRQGWKFYHQVKPGVEVLGYDVTTRQLTWTIVKQVSVFDNAPLVRIGNSRFSAVCTPDHKWVLDDRLVPWEERSGRAKERITLAAPIDCRGGDPDMAARLGWLMTDAQMKYAAGLPSRADVTQSKPEHFAEIDRLFGEASRERETSPRYWQSGRVSTTLPQRTWFVSAQTVRTILGTFGVASPADLPIAVLNMTRDEAQAFFDAAMAADGSGRTFAKTNASVVEAVQLAAVLIGRSTGIIKERPGNEMTTKPCLTVSIHGSGHKYTSEFKTTPLPPQAVWCPTTETGTWVANFNGFIGITGNTKALGRALAALGFGTQFCDDFTFGAHENRVVDSPVNFQSRAASVDRDHFPPVRDQRPQGGGSAQPATSKQLQFISSIARELNLSDESLHLEAQTSFGAEIGELSRRDASILIERLQQRRQQTARGGLS